MFPSFLRRSKSRARASWGKRLRSAKPCRFLPRLERLEDRQLPSVSASLVFLTTTFIRYNDGELFLHDPTGFRKIDINVASVSAGSSQRSVSGEAEDVDVAFIVYNNGQLFEWAQDTGFQFIDSNVVGVVGNRNARDSAFILYNNGELFRHDGTSPVSGFTFIAGAVTSMSPAFGNGDVFYVQSNNILSEHLVNGGSMPIDGNVQSVSGGQLESDSAFILYTNSALFFFNPNATQRFRLIDTNVASVNGSRFFIPTTGLDLDAAYYVRRDGALVEWVAPSAGSLSPDGTYVFLDSNVASISAGDGFADEIFIVYNNGMLFDHTGYSRISGFTFIDSNVSP
jgi:hypothetical protein